MSEESGLKQIRAHGPPENPLFFGDKEVVRNVRNSDQKAREAHPLDLFCQGLALTRRLDVH